MKQTFYLLFTSLVFIFCSCNNSAKNKAEKTANAINDVMENSGPPTVGTSDEGYAMSAVIDGKTWKAASMLQINEMNDQRVLGEKGEIKIGFNIPIGDAEVGDEWKFGEMRVADLFTPDEVGVWGGREGKVTITKVDGKLVEGTFYFTGTTHTDPNKSILVKNGFFRVLLKK